MIAIFATLYIPLLANYLSATLLDSPSHWICPVMREANSCNCNMEHTLRCTLDSVDSLATVAEHLRQLQDHASSVVTLFDCTLNNVTSLPPRLFYGVKLRGLVITSGKIGEVDAGTFDGMSASLNTLGLPNNMLQQVPIASLQPINKIHRLDLSHNKLHTLADYSFQNLSKLSFLDLSNNAMRMISENAFYGNSAIVSLQLNNNRLSKVSLNGISSLSELRELNLESNWFAENLELGDNIVLPKLRTLSISRNRIQKLTMGTLRGFESLTAISLHHNQIDVIEDNAFGEIGIHLSSLDLSYNRIVSVSVESFAHLDSLQFMDLSHNFLTTVSNDLISSLRGVRSLHLDDNDISVIERSSLDSLTSIESLSLADNPIVCDCTARYLATWMNESVTLPDTDKRSVRCATPPLFANAVLVDLDMGQLQCSSETGSEHSWLEFVEFEAKNTNVVSLKWILRSNSSFVNPSNFECGSLLMYQIMGKHEILVDNRSDIGCNYNSSQFESLLLGIHAAGLYRFCLVLHQIWAEDDRIVGCSHSIKLDYSIAASSRPNIKARLVNLSNLNVTIYRPYAFSENSINMTVFDDLDAPLSTKTINFDPGTTAVTSVFINVPEASVVCASISDSVKSCVRIDSSLQAEPPSLYLCLGSVIIVLIICLCIRSMRQKRSFTPNCRATNSTASYVTSMLPNNNGTSYVKLQTAV